MSACLTVFRTVRRVFWVQLAIIFLIAGAAWGQKDMGSIVGTVRDSSGAVLPGAKVTVSDIDRGTTFNTTTNSNGEYVANPLRVGQYNVTVEHEGFRKDVVGPIQVNVQSRVEVNPTLRVGQIAETVTVTSQTPQLETETSELGHLVSGRQATTLPLNGRNFAQLAQLTAGVAPAEPGSRTETTFGFSSNGARALQNNYLLDGIDNNANLADVLNGSAYVIQPSVDAIGEFKVETNSYSAEFGRGNGAILNAVIKSGTNAFHGNVYEFFRNDKLDGRNAFDFLGRQPYQQNQFGATFGGPIIKDRTFFFVDYEGLRIRQALPQLLLIPTPAQLSGDFSSFLDTSAPLTFPGTNTVVTDCAGHATYLGEIFDPHQTGSGPCGVPIGGYNAAGFPTNIFPAGSINPVAARIAALYPAPLPGFAVNGNNYLVDPKKSLNQNNFDVRVDHRFTNTDDVFARFSYEDQPIFTPGPFTNFLDGGGFTAGHQDNAYRSAAVSWTHTFSPTLINEARLGYNRINSNRLQAFAGTDVSGQLGLKGVPFIPGNGGLPNMCFVNYSCIGSSGFLPSIEKQNSYVINENLIWIRGKHSLKFGTEIRLEQFTMFQDSSPHGDLAFGQDFTSNPALPVDANGNPTGGEDIASFLLGVPDSADISSIYGPDYHRKTYAIYGQDDIRVNERLTLNLGLRWEYFHPVTEGHNRMATFDFASGSLIVPKGETTPPTPTIASFLPLQRTGSNYLVNPDYRNFAPRIGFAYKISNPLVLRGGYGIFYGGQESGPFSFPSPGFNPPYFLQQSFSSPCGSPVTPDTSTCAIGLKPGDTTQAISNFWTQGFPATSLSDPNNPLVYSIDRNLRTPMMQQWHLGFEYQMASQTVLGISYAGSSGQHLYGFYNGNQALPSPDPAAPLAPRRPFPAIDGTIDAFRSNTSSNYNSLQVSLEKRMTHGLMFQASYTYAHALDNASSASLGSLANGDFRDQRFPFLEYGNADFDVRHRFTLSYSYDLPFGRGKMFAGNAHGVIDQIIGNWQIAGITSAGTGNYFTVTDPFVNSSNTDCGGTVGYNCSRPNVVGNPNATPCQPGTFFNTCAFTSNLVQGTYGNERRNQVRGPGFQTWDMTFAKLFPVKEQMRVEFRADFFNIWNHTNPLWGPIGAAGQVEPVAIEINTPQFGQYQAARDPRLVQFALKFYF